MPDPDGSSSDRSIPEPDSALGVEIGAVIAGKYRVERVIGKGGMGVVVAASQPELARTVAIKLIRSDSSDDRSAIARLLREAKAAASIQSEHVARVLDVGTLDSGVPFIVMEYLEGSDLQTLLDRDGPMRSSEAVDDLLQACEAIAEAHRNGIVHRDLKPANLFIARLPGGRTCVKVVDFGISKAIGRDTGEPLTQPASVVGSLYHMAPEQMRGGPVDARTDVWALGLVLYEMLSGCKPFGNQAWPAVAAQVLSDGPLVPMPIDGVSDDLSAVIQRCLSRAPEQRYGTVAELAVALSRFGSRNAHLSLERIVLLATSTGSLSALALEPTEPARDSVSARFQTRPLPGGGFPAAAAGGFAPVPLPRSSVETPARATPATPFPVSTGPRPGATPPSRFRLALGVAGALALLAPALFWAWPSSPVPTASEQRAPLQPLAPEPAGSADVERVERGALENPTGAEARGGVAGTPLTPSASGAVAAGGAGAAGAAGVAGAAGAAARERTNASEGGDAPRPARPPNAASGANAPTVTPAASSTKGPADNASEAAAEPPSPPRPPAKAPAKASSPWDLHDIEFHEARP